MAYKYSFGSEKILTKKDGKMKDTLEIRWHGRGGQGAKTAALLLAEVAFKTGKNAQGFLNMVRKEWVPLLLHMTESVTAY